MYISGEKYFMLGNIGHFKIWYWNFVTLVKYAKYVADRFPTELCLICTSPYFMLSFLMLFFLNLEAKSIDFVLSSPKKILSLLSPNQSLILEKCTFKFF